MSRRIRVASIARIANIGGDENRLLQTALAVDQDAVEQTVLIVDPDTGLSERERLRWTAMRDAYCDAGVAVVDVSAPDRRAVGATTSTPRLIGRLARELRSRDIDVVDARMGMPATVGLPAARLARVPVTTFTTYYTNLFDPPIRYLIGQGILGGIDALISDAQSTLDDFTRWRWSDQADLVLIRNGIQPASSPLDRGAARRALGLPMGPEVPVIGQISRIMPRKAFDVFVRAAALTASVDDEAQFAAIGFVAESERDHLRQLETLRDDLGMRDRLHFVAYPGPVGDALAAIDVFAHLSYADSSPFAIHEAMSVGKPSIISALPGNRELVDDGVTGLLVPSGDAAASATAMLRLVGDRDLAAAIGAGALARFDQRHRPEHMAAAHVELWQRLLAERGVSL